MAEVKYFLDQARRQVVLLSATCPPKVEEKLGAELATELETFRRATSRENLAFHILPHGKEDAALRALEKFGKDEDDRAIVFVHRIDDVARIEQALHRFSVVGLHGQLTKEEKKRRLTEWKDKARCVLVATTAAAHGVDYPRVSCVVVLFDPEDTNVLAQMVGRGGRNGSHCSCFLHADTRKSTWFGKHPECIRHALYSFVDGEDLAYMCSSRAGVARCMLCVDGDLPPPLPAATPNHGSTPPSLDIESITATVRESIKHELKESLLEDLHAVEEIYTRRIGEQNERISGLEKTVVAKDLRIGELEQAVEEAKKQEKALDEFRQREGQTQAELRNQVEHMGSLKEEMASVQTRISELAGQLVESDKKRRRVRGGFGATRERLKSLSRRGVVDLWFIMKLSSQTARWLDQDL